MVLELKFETLVRAEVEGIWWEMKVRDYAVD